MAEPIINCTDIHGPLVMGTGSTVVNVTVLACVALGLMRETET